MVKKKLRVISIVKKKTVTADMDTDTATATPAPSKKVRRQSVSSDDGEMMSTRDAWTFSMTLVCYIMYPTLVRFPFELLQCRELDGSLYLQRDLQEICYVKGSRHFTYLFGLAIPALLIYAIGIPIGSFLVLWRARNRLNTNKYRFRLGLLFSGYREDRWYWEVVVATRKVFIISLASFGFNDSIQVHLVLGLMLILLVIHYTYQPFDVKTREGELLHRVERNSLLTLICMLWAGVVFIMYEHHNCITTLCLACHNMLVVLVVLVNVVLLLYGGYLFVYFLLVRNHVFEKIEKIHIKERFLSFKKKESEYLSKRFSSFGSFSGMSTRLGSFSSSVSSANINPLHNGDHSTERRLGEDKKYHTEKSWVELQNMINPLVQNIPGPPPLPANLPPPSELEFSSERKTTKRSHLEQMKAASSLDGIEMTKPRHRGRAGRGKMKTKSMHKRHNKPK